jgi:hypothetical protein
VRFRSWILRIGMLVAVVVAIAPATAAQAATIAVTNGNDSGAGSLRAAVTAANPGDTITIPALTVSLTSGQISIGKNLTITGAGARQTTISGTGQSRVFDVTAGAVSISAATITGGDGFDMPGGTAGAGGGILVGGGSLTLADAAVSGNQTTGTNEGSGIQADGHLTVQRSTISDNGNPGSLRGGGIEAEGSGTTLLVTNSTLANNALKSGGLGAAVYVNSASVVTFTNDTVGLNTAGATGSALDFNAGAFGAAITIANTVVDGGPSESCSRVGSTSPSAGGNIEDQNLCGFTASSDETNTDPHLGPLQNNGGSTDTLLPATGSRAIDAGIDAFCPAADQRGVPRPQGPHCDSGAVELSAPSAGTPTVSSIGATGANVTGTANAGFWGGTYRYRYGTTTSYGQSTASATLGAGAGSLSAPAALSGLTPGATYHLQLMVTTPDGTATSPDVTFTTHSVPPPPAAPPLAPTISSLRVSPHRFSLAGRMVGGRCVTPTWAKNKGTHCRRPISLRVSFSLNVGATVTITLKRQLAGRKVNGRCIKPTSNNNTKHSSCTWLVAVSGKLLLVGTPGANQFAFNGKLGGRQLGAGTYQLSATPTGGKPTPTMFTIAS